MMNWLVEKGSRNVIWAARRVGADREPIIDPRGISFAQNADGFRFGRCWLRRDHSVLTAHRTSGFAAMHIRPRHGGVRAA